jgi:linoleoyl-CoA desaturase
VPRYEPNDAFPELRRRVAAALRDAGRTPLGDWRIWSDVVVVTAWVFGSYLVLLLVPLSAPLVALVVLSFGVALTASLTHVVHASMHGAVARTRRVNLLVAQLFAPWGVSWHWWTVKHNSGHHGYLNIDGFDPDLDQGALMRWTESQPWHPWHRYQHVYAWALYPFLTLRYVVAADVGFLFTGKFKGRRIEAPSVRRTTLLLLDKLGPLMLLLVPALLLHPTLQVLGIAVAVLLVNGMTTVLVFLSTHYTEEAANAVPDADGHIDEEWAACVARATTSLAVRNRTLRWYLAGQDRHLEHHLFPRVAHVHYPVIKGVVRDWCTEHELPYHERPSLLDAWRSHQRRMRVLGRAQTTSSLEVAALEGSP